MNTTSYIVPACPDITDKLSLQFNLVIKDDQQILEHWNDNNIGELLAGEVLLLNPFPEKTSFLFTMRHLIEFCIRRPSINMIFQNFTYLMDAYLDLIPTMNKSEYTDKNINFDFEDILFTQKHGDYQFILSENGVGESDTAFKLNRPKQFGNIHLIDILDLPIFYDKNYNFNTWFNFITIFINSTIYTVNIVLV